MPSLKFREVFVGTRATPIARTHWGHWQYKQTSEKGIHTAVTLATRSFPPSCCRNYKIHLLGNLVTVKKMHSLSETLWLFETASSFCGKKKISVLAWRQWYHGHQSLHTGPQLGTAHSSCVGCSGHPTGAITKWQCVCHWEESGPAALMEMKRWEHPSLQWDLPPAMSAHPAAPNSTKITSVPAAPTPLWPPGLCIWRCESCFCLISWQQTFPVKPPLQEHIWGRYVYFRHTVKWKLCWYKGRSVLELLNYEVRQTLQIATTEQWLLWDVVTVWLCLYTGAKQSPKELRCSVCPGSARGWMTVRNPFFFFWWCCNKIWEDEEKKKSFFPPKCKLVIS